MRKNIKGITLIALVITIVVLLILASVSIAMLTGENGILTRAISAKEASEKATIEEQIELAVLASKTNTDAEIDKTVLEAELNKYGITNITKSDGDDLPWTIKKEGFVYIISSDGEISESNSGSDSESEPEEEDKPDTLAPNSFTPTVQYNYVELKDASNEIKTAYNFTGSFEGANTSQYGYNNDVAAGEIFYITSAYDQTAYGFGSASIGYYQCTADHTNHTSPYYLSGFCKYLGESYTVPSTSAVISGSTTDQPATDTSSSSGIAKYYFSNDNGTTWLPTEGQTSPTYTFEGLTLGTSYTFKMKAVDNAGNETISNPILELKDASDTIKTAYNFTGSFEGSSAYMYGYSYDIKAGEIFYITSAYNDIGFAGEGTLEVGYYKCKEDHTNHTNPYFLSKLCEYLGENYLVEQK